MATFRNGRPCPPDHVDKLISTIKEQLESDVKKMTEQKVPASCITFVLTNPVRCDRSTIGHLDYTLDECLTRARSFLSYCMKLPRALPRHALRAEAVDGRNTRRLERILKESIEDDPDMWKAHVKRMQS
jgi:hypothetical protein